MHVEVQVALNFLISFLYNKLPRRRVNQFGEELEQTLKTKFEGHWYEDTPCKGSAYRCIRCAPPLDPLIFEVAARNSGMDLLDLEDNLPHELSIWVDPGEVSYRISEKSPVKILYSDRTEMKEPLKEHVSVLNPEAQCFKPVDRVMNVPLTAPLNNNQALTNSGSSVNPFVGGGKNSNHVTFTTAMFAATKFGSTKLKANGKKGQRSSPTDFGDLLKHKSIPPRDFCSFNKRNFISSFSPIDANDMPLTNPQSNFADIDCWKSSTTALPNIWAALPQQKATHDGGNMFYEEGQLGTETHDFLVNNLAQVGPKRASQSGMGSLESNGRLAFVSDRIWEEIFHLSPENSSDLGQLEARAEVGAVGGEGSERNEPLYCSAFSLSSMSSPSLSFSNESGSLNLNLLSEFDNLSLNSSSSSTTSGSASSYIT